MMSCVFAVCVLCLVCFSLAGCGSSASTESAPAAAYDTKNAAQSDIAVLGDSAGTSAGEAADTADGDTDNSGSTEDVTDKTSAVLDSDKIIYTADISMSSKEFDKAEKEIKAAAEKYGAIVQSENFYEGDTNWYIEGSTRDNGSRSYYVSLRVPSGKFNELVNATGSMDAVIDSKNTTADNISQEYSDKKAEIEALELELKQLQAIMEKATRVQDVMDVQQRITEVQTQLNQDKSDLNRMDLDVAYSYVNITLSEVQIYDEKPDPADASFSQKLISSFTKSLSEFAEFCKGFVIFIVRNWIKLLILIAVIVLVIRLIKKNKKKSADRKKNSPQMFAVPPMNAGQPMQQPMQQTMQPPVQPQSEQTSAKEDKK